MTLRGRNVLLGVCGSIAAYKAAYLVRLLIKQGAEVRVVMTPSALDFVTPLTLSTLSHHPVVYSFTEDERGTWNNHVELALWADLILIAPATENTIGKMAHGICDNLLLSVYFSAKCPVYICPAMDLDMYQHFSTTENISLLKKNGHIIIDAETGELASGLTGQGRLAEPEHILAHVLDTFGSDVPLSGKKILITAGPTYEALDPVRFIGNHSTGKMGIALAIRAWKMGAEVVFVHGPVKEELLQTLPEQIQKISVTSGKQMHEAVMSRIAQQHIAIFAAAVADYTPAQVSDVKIKKSDDTFNLTLTRNPDIAKECGAAKRSDQIFVGFALETNNEELHALQKLESKNLDAIILNSMNDQGAGFGHDTNKITIMSKGQSPLHMETKSKELVAADILHYIIRL